MVKLTEKQSEILTDLLSQTNVTVYNMCIREHRTHYIYRRRFNYLVHKYFDGDTLRCSTFMCNLFNLFVPEGNEMKAKDLAFKIKSQKETMKLAKRYIRDYYLEAVEQYNKMVEEYNELYKGNIELGKLYSKISGTKLKLKKS